MIAAIILTFITAYLIGALVSAPKLMRLIYQDKMAILAEGQADYERQMEEYRNDRTARAYKPMRIGRTELDCRNQARTEGFWWSLVWPLSLAFHALAGTAFKAEVAAQHAAANTKIIADYDALLASRFEKELEAPTPRSFLNRIKGRTK